MQIRLFCITSNLHFFVRGCEGKKAHSHIGHEYAPKREKGYTNQKHEMNNWLSLGGCNLHLHKQTGKMDNREFGSYPVFSTR